MTRAKHNEETAPEPQSQAEVTEEPAAAIQTPSKTGDEKQASAADESAQTPPAPDWHDRYLRLAAEFDNFRKRSAREFESLVRNAEGDLIAELTDALDNLDRAVDGDHKGESLDDFARGIAMIRDQLRKTLDARGLERMKTVGQPFDPESHDALMRAPSDEHDEGIITQEIAPGYRLNGKVLRHAQVVVSQGSDKGEDAE